MLCVCYAVSGTDSAGAATCYQVGLRCHGDCDVVMRHVLLKLMGASKFEAWVAECEAKKAGYEVKRPRV